MPPGAPARLALALGLGLWLGALAGDPGRGCGPCPLPCFCSLAPDSACRVNCSGRWLQTLEPSLRIPADATALDLSHNLLQTLDIRLLVNLSALVELDISNNRISTLEEGVFANLFNLSEINLSENPFECNCGLVWLPRWAKERRVHVVQPEAATCRGPIPLAGQPLLSFPLLDSACGEDYVACLPDNSSGAAAAVPFYFAHEGPLESEACSAFCFSAGESLAALSEQSQCFCGAGQPPNTSAACSSWCSSFSLSLSSACGGPTLLQHVFPASPGAALVGPHGPLASGQPADFHITSPLPISSTRWNFGDGSPEVDVAGPAVTHSYVLPGSYHVIAVLALGTASALLETEVQVEAAPAVLELVCPSSVHSDESLELGLRHRGGSALEVTYSILALEKEPAQVVHPLCPSDTEIFPGNGHCYRLVAEKAPWLQAQEQCRTWAGAALAMVDSPAIQHFLVSQVTRSLDVWIGFSSVEGAEEGLDPQGEAFSLESCQNWLPGEPHPATAEHCVRLGPAGQCNTDLCSAPHSYVCELRPGGPLWDAESFLVGVSGGGLSGPLHPLAQQETLRGPLQPVEVMVFPGLSPSREAFLTAAEFETVELERPVQLRLQVYRPSREAVAPEGSSEPDNRTELAPKCVPEEHWCPGANVCAPFDASCSPYVCVNGSMAGLGLPRANYTLWKEFLFSVPAGPPTQYLVTLHGQDVPVLPGDLIGIQHDAGPGTLLHCPVASSCPGQALYLSTNASNWLTHLSTHLEEAWAGPACSFQLLLVTEQFTPLLGLESNPGLQHPGRYEVRATVGNSVSRHNLSCNFNVVSPVAGLRVIHPISLDGHLYVPTNGSALVLQVDSGANATATAHWFGGNISAPFEDACPLEMDILQQDCTEESNSTLFSVLMLPRLTEGDHAVEIVAQNGASQANLSLRVTAEEPIFGLRAVPSPEARVLQGILVRYSPMVEAGSDVTFRWTIDDKPSLTFHNTVFNVIYQTAAIFKLSLTASNHVSNVTVNYNVTVERMNKMRGLWVSAVPAVLPPNATLVLTGGVLVDSAVEVAFLWNFGDGEQVLRQFKPPYDESFQVPDPTVAQVLVEHNTTHVYASPGEYNLTVLVFNTYENLTQQVPVSVRTVLPSVAIGMSSNILVAGRPITFSPYPLPSADGVLYTWDFGDGSPVLIQSQPALNHTYTMTGTYRIILEVNNTVSSVAAHIDIHVFQELRGLAVCLSPSVEQGAPMVVSATVESGDNITWTFDMGDGTVFKGPEATVQHVYLRAQNCTVTVVAASPVGHLSQSLHVQVFVLEVLRIEPSTCIPTQPSAQLMAHVTGNPADYLFDWTFGDGSSNVTVYGHPIVTHNFTRSGTFPLALVLSSHVNKAHYFTSICVEPEIRNITLQPERQFVKLGDEAWLVAYSWPPFPYHYTWDFGTEDATHTHTGGSEVTFIYREPGSYLVVVTVSNNISATNDSAFVEVQEPVLVTGIRINGSHVLELQQPYLFSAVGSGSPATYLWELGDGSQREGPEVTHIYSSTGDFTVRVSGWNEVSRSEAQLNITVKQRVQGLTVSASRTVVPLNGSVSFSTLLEVGSDVHYSWVLCDRCTPIPGGPTISYTFRSVGTFNIIVTAENEVGSAQDSIFIYVLQLIEGLQVVGGGGSCCFPTNYTLQLQAAVRDGTNISFSWTAQQDGGLTLTGSGKSFLLTALKASTYHIHLRATNMLGSATANRTIDFVEPVERLILSASPNPAAVNVNVTLGAEVAGGSGIVYTWYLEEGLSWETLTPSTTHAFATAGLHLVRVTAENQLGSVNATIEVAIQVPVSGLSIRTSEPDKIFVAAGSTVPFWGQLAAGTNVSWCWALPGGNKHGQYIAVRLPTSGNFSVQLNASNAVSWASAMYNLTVEEPIVSLVLWASSKVVAPGQPVHFQILLAAGSAVTFRLQVGGSIPEVLPGPHFSHSFFRVGDHMVNVQAENHVSRAQAQIRILVLEAVVGLQVPNCCEPGMATGTEKNFTARVQRGSRVAYAWYFSLQKVQGDSLVILSGRDVTYTPVAAGLLEIHVRAFNELGGVNLTLMVEVQDIIQYVKLESGRCFTNRSSRFEAATSPSSRRVTYHWDFGDGTPVQDTDVSWADHCYLHPGDYRVEVNATNLVSFFVAQATVTVQVLACREPEVEVALPLQVLMRRSQRNYLEAHVDLRNCVSYQTEYRWEIYRTASCQRPGRMAQMVLPGVDVSRPQLVVPRLALPVGHYCFVFVVSFGDTPLARSIQANVTVAAERLVPIIEGGSYRVWSDTQDLVLDGSKSYDPNLEDGDQTPLNFHWACVASTQSEAGGCVLNFGPRGSSMVTIPLERLEAGVEYTFNLIVWKAGRKEEATNQTVLIRSGRVPIVSLECVSCRAQAVYGVSRSSYVYLEGHCDNCSSGSKQGRWAARTFSNKTLVLDETTTSTGSTGMHLVVRRGALRDGEGYIFTLTVLGHSGEEEGCASIRLSPNRPPLGGSCRLFPLDAVRGLTTKVHFECTGWRDAEDGGAPLVYALLLRRCRQSYCEDFCIYKGSLSTYGAVLPPGFGPLFVVGLAVVVQDQFGAAVVALNRSLTIVLPEPSGNPADLIPWLYSLTASVLPGLLRQADPQHVIEYSLALITVLNEYERAPDVVSEPSHEQQLRAQMRKNITETLISLRVNTVDDIQQITAALAQCMVSSRELMCRPCLKTMLQKLEGMMRILQAETTEGTVTPTAIADSILNITGDLIHLASLDMQGPQPLELGAEPPSPMVASKAYNLSSALMCILMRSRVLNEEPLALVGEEIVALGKRSDPLSLLCYGKTLGPSCHFSIPEAFSGALSNLSDVVQLIFLVDSNPFPFGYISNYTVSTKVASMAFQTQTGTQIPIERLASERAITVKVPNNLDQAAQGSHNPAGSTILQPQASVSAVVTADNSNPQAGLHLRITYTVLNERYLSEEPEPYLAVYLHSVPQPNEYNCSASRRISLEVLEGADHRPYTFFIAPGTGSLGRSYYLNLTSHFHWSALEVSVGLYTSLCQYFSEEMMMWRTEGIVPLEETSPSQAVCLTRHLTAFGASLFVPPSHVQFIFPEPSANINYIVLLTYTICLVTYVVMAVILRKLDQLDVSRVRVIPFCGKGGRFKYEILVKTGWSRGSGTTAHVGIMLYGEDNRSGHRHLDGDRAFHRNSLDIFQIATPHSLGSVWKIRVWHDNKGLSPAWFLQHVIVRDLQSARSTFFLVNDWLSVETEANGGLVEKEVLAANEAALWQFQRLLVAELQRGFFDKHIWLSIWDRPPRSRFTRVQRVTCCVLLLCLFLAANAVWYGVVGDSTYSVGPVSNLIPPSVDTVAIGLVSSVVVYPVYLAVLFLFRMSRSKVSGDQHPTPTGPQALDVDSYLDPSVLDSSLLTLSGLTEQALAGQVKDDLFLEDAKSLVCWPSSEGTLSWPDLLSDPSVVSSTLQQLVQNRPGRMLGPEEDGVSLVSPSLPAKYLSASDEDLIQQVLADGASNLVPTQDALIETDLLTSLSSVPREKTETLMLQTLGEKRPASMGLTWEQPLVTRLSRTGLVEGLRKRLLPAWCAPLAHGLSLLLVAVAVAVSGWIGASFPPSVSVMWLLSSTSSFLASFLGWEPLKVLLEALYFSLIAKRLHPDEDDTLVESPAVTPVSERVPRVRPPHGFALFLAKEEARKVKKLHDMLKSLLVYMLFLLVTLLANYGDASCHGHAYRLQSAIKQELDSQAFLAITRSDEFWPWMSHVLLPYVHGNQSSPELGPPRLRQVRLQEALCPDPSSPEHMCSATASLSSSDYGIGWQSVAQNGSETWSYSAPDLLGAWYWGYCAVYDSGGYVQELGLSLEESRARLGFLQLHNWLDSRSRAVFVELTRYSPAVGLHAAVTLRLEFPVAGHALAAFSVRPFALRRLSTGLSLPLLTSVCLLLFALYFSMAEVHTWRREGCARTAQPDAWARWLLVMLTAATGLVRLAQLAIADRQWTHFVHDHPRHFTSFDQVAQLGSVARGLAASLLFLLLIKAAQQLRFVRQWSVFGKTLCRALPELMGATLGLVVLGVAYAQMAVLLISSGADTLHNMARAFLVLCPGARVPALCPSESWYLSPLLCVGLWALRMWGALRLGAVLLRWRYHALRGELYRPAWEPQDYEMVELFLRRLRLWMGFSKVKEFRHKVRFEGMEPLPSRSSRDSKSSPVEPPPSAGSDASRPSTSSSQPDGLSAGFSRSALRLEPEPSRLHAVFETLLVQFDRLNQATEDVYQLEQQLQSLRGHGHSGPLLSPSPGCFPGPQTALPSQGLDLAIGPSKKSPRSNNKVHPSST